MDIVDRLRELYVNNGTNYVEEAAREIERLRVDAEMYRSQLTKDQGLVQELCLENERLNGMLMRQAGVIEKIHAERDALKRDAERYRFLRNPQTPVTELEVVGWYLDGPTTLQGSSLDAAIDAAHRGEGE